MPKKDHNNIELKCPNCSTSLEYYDVLAPDFLNKHKGDIHEDWKNHDLKSYVYPGSEYRSLYRFCPTCVLLERPGARDPTLWVNTVGMVPPVFPIKSVKQKIYRKQEEEKRTIQSLQSPISQSPISQSSIPQSSISQSSISQSSIPSIVNQKIIDPFNP